MSICQSTLTTEEEEVVEGALVPLAVASELHERERRGEILA